MAEEAEAEDEGGGGGTHFMHHRSLNTIDPRILQGRHRARRVLTDQADIACTQREAQGGGGYSFVACLSYLTIYHAPLSKRSTVPTPKRHTSNVWAHITFLPCIT